MPPSNRPEADRAAEGLLVDRCRRGDPAAFEEIYRRHAPRVYSLAYRLTGSLADAEDLLQEAFLLVHRKLDSFKGESALGTWIYRLATNCCVDFLRSRQHREDQTTDTLD
jgi:RNA polymerase sigma-70 factor (ECF subfamily)